MSSNLIHPPPLPTTPSCSKSSSSTPLRPPPSPNTHRAVSIRFAPLPDPRASRAIPSSNDGDPDVWWSRQELPDGTWGHYRLVLRTPDGAVIPVDQLELGSDGRNRALQRYLDQQPQPPSLSASSSSQDPPLLLPDPSARRPDQLFGSAEDLARLVPPAGSSHSLTSTPAGSLVSLSNTPGPALSRTTSSDSSNSITSSNPAADFNKRDGSSSSLMKLFDAMRKPLRPSYRLRSTSSLPNEYPYSTPPLCKTRSAESSGTISKRLSGGLWKANLAIRRTQSKDEQSSSQASQQATAIDGLERPRRRSNYPPVAQRKVHMGGSRGGAGRVVVDEPAFVEWRPASGTAAPKGAGQQAGPSVEEDDGSGMAWLRKRKREREERARREEQEGADPAAAGSSGVSESEPPAGPSPAPQLVVSLESTNTDKKRHISRPSSSNSSATTDSEDLITNSSGVEVEPDGISTQSSSASCQTGRRASALGSESSSNKEEEEDDEEEERGVGEEQEEDLDEEELLEEERLKALAMAESPFVKGAKEVYRDREHHRMLKS